MMKNIHLTTIIIFISFTVSFATFQVEEISECDSINNELTSKFRFLGEWNSNGVPKYLQPEADEVSQSLINYIKETLPERVNISNSNGKYFGDDVQLNTELIEDSEVYLTMVHEGAGWKNTLGFYTYDVNNPPATVYDIDSLVVIFPNVSQPNIVKAGDKVLLGEFPANTGIGYFLIAQGWVGDTICLKSHIVFTHKHLNTFTSEEYQQQTILLSFYDHEKNEDRFLLSFEDIKRPGGDNDFNDAVFYITADSIGGPLPKIPTAFISGDTTLCDENAPATVKVELTGQAPWTIIYDNGIEEIEISGIEDTIFLFETLMKDTVTLVSVEDKSEIGIVSGKAIITLSQPKATLKEDQVITCNGENQNGFIIDFEGLPPFSLTYSENDEEKTTENIIEDQYELIAPVGSIITLITMSDQSCEGTVSGAASVKSFENPTLEIVGSGAICGDDTHVVLDLKLGGNGPWIVNYQLGDQEYNLQIESSEYQLEISELGTLTFIYIQDANCSTTLTTSIDIQKKSLPTALIENLNNSCSDEVASIDIALTGEGPWKIHYKLNGESRISESNEDLANLFIEQSGAFELTGVEDVFCENIAEGSLEIEILNAPTAFISNDPSFCSDEEANIKISLTGTPPFTLVYTDGENETSVTTTDFLYEFITNELNTYRLVSIVDKYCSGEVDGEVTINFFSPKATLRNEKAICEENNQGGFVIDFEGQAPFTLTYLENDQDKTIKNIEDNQYELIAPIGSNIELISMSDQFCDGIVVGNGTVSSIEKPTLIVEGNGSKCGDEIKAIFNLTLGGQGPWILYYQIGDQEYNLQIETSEYQLEISETGTLIFNSLEDSNCTSTLTTSVEIENRSLPTAIISDFENSCGDEVAAVYITLTGEGPWQVHYSMNGEQQVSESNENLLKLIINQSGTFELERVEDAYCDNLAEGTIEFEIHEAPTAVISSITAFCNDEAATIQINLTGTAPYTFVYSDGENETSITIEENIYEFTTTELKTYTLVSVNDANCKGEVEGEAIVNFSQPKATLRDDQALCEENDQGGFIIDLEGQAPFSLTFNIEGQEKTVDNITENQFEVLATVGSSIELISMRDQFCEGTVTGIATIRSLQKPSLAVEGNEALCGDDANVIFNLNLSGQGPWVINYNIDNQAYELQIESSEYQLEISESGTLTFNSIKDANCQTTLSSSFNIQENSLPTAIIENFENSCGDASTTIDITLTGEGPWQVHYTMNGEQKTSESNESLLSLEIDQSGTFELIGVEDAYCDNVASGNIELEIHDSPTAFIGDDATICKEEEATIQITLTGVAPFTFIYTDGESETSITTEENIYEISTTEFNTYTLLSITDAYCDGEVDGSATISDGAEDIQVEIDADDIACFGDVIELVLLGETDGLSIEWSTEGKGTLENIDQIETTYTPAENEIGVVVFYVEVSNSCAVKTISKEVTILEEVIANFRFSPENDLTTNTQIIFTPENNKYDEYTWDFGDGNSSSANISSTEYSEGGTYTVELSVTIEGCEANGSEELAILSKDELYVPNAFNPSAQNPENRVVKVYGNNIDETGFSFKIVNRWGKTMYQTGSFFEANSIGWDGVNNNNNEKQELSVFSYILKGRFIEGESFEKAGTITQVK